MITIYGLDTIQDSILKSDIQTKSLREILNSHYRKKNTQTPSRSATENMGVGLEFAVLIIVADDRGQIVMQQPGHYYYILASL